MHRICGTVLGLLLIALNAAPGAAQMFSQGTERPRPVRTMSAGYQWIDFAYNGARVPSESFDYRSPAYVISFTQPNLHTSIAWGRQDADPDEGLRELRLIDAELFLWGGFPIAGSPSFRLYLPLVLHSGYRSVDEREQDRPSIDAFNLTTLGLGTGLGFEATLGGDVQLEAQATPVGGLALRSLEGTAGRTWLVRGTTRLHFPRLFRRYGLSVGYSYRYQRWNIDASDLFPELSDDLFDYENNQHVFHVGVNW